jgi:excisionase family DNA binding protein
MAHGDDHRHGGVPSRASLKIVSPIIQVVCLSPVSPFMNALSHAQIQSEPQRDFEPLLDPRQVAALLRIHPKTLVRLARQVRVPAIRVGKHRRFRASALNEWLATQPTMVNSGRQSN